MKQTISLASFLITSFVLVAQPPTNHSGFRGAGDRMQTGRFYGRILDSTHNKAIEYASVQLLENVFDTLTKQLKQGVVVAGQLTLENGDFSLEKIEVMSKYKLKISAMGYATKELPISFKVDMEKMKSGGGMPNADLDLGNIKLKQLATELKGVEVIASAPAMELKLDKKVFNVEKNIVSAGGTAEDVLKQVPSVSVDMDGNVSLRNAAPQLFVDGKPTVLTLDQIPAAAIQSIEVITNPSAKYDASGGQGGILNIVLKKEKRLGYNGNLRAGIDQRAKMNGGADLNLREGKTNFFISANANQRYSIAKGSSLKNNLQGSPLTDISQSTYNLSNGLFLQARGGVDWFMNNRNTFTFSGNYLKGRFAPIDSLLATTDSLYPTPTHSWYHRQSETFRRFHNTGGSLQYKHLFPKEGNELTADFNYNSTQFVGGGDTRTQYLTNHYTPTGNLILQKSQTNGGTDVITTQTDYINKINERSKIESGLMGTYRIFTSKSDNYLKKNGAGEFTLIPNQSVNYTFNDQIYAGYLIYSLQKEKISYQAGLRTESSFYIGKLVDSNKVFKNIFPAAFFPNIAATYALNKNDNLQFSYSRKVKRPTFFQLIPYTDYTDSLNLTRGNPSLQAEFTNSFELSYQKIINSKHNLLVTGYFKNSTRLITNYQAREYDSFLKKEVIINTYQNANESFVYGAELTSKHHFATWIEMTFNLNAYQSKINAGNIQTNLTNERFSWFAKNNITIKLPKNITLQLSGEYKSKSALPMGGGGGGGMGRNNGWFGGPIASLQGYQEALYSIDVAVKYDFLKNKAASVTLNARDIFSSDLNKTVTRTDYFYQTTERLRDPCFFRLNFSYRFGKFDASLFKRKNTKVNMDGGL
jgi:outer membrane receptor protein involved in Fe transport